MTDQPREPQTPVEPKGERSGHDCYHPVWPFGRSNTASNYCGSKPCEPITDEWRVMAEALVEISPGWYQMPPSGCPSEGIPYKINALWDAKKLLNIVAREEKR